MIRIDYMKPIVKVVKLQHQGHLLNMSRIEKTISAKNEVELEYDSEGDDQEYAW